MMRQLKNLRDWRNKTNEADNFETEAVRLFLNFFLCYLVLELTENNGFDTIIYKTIML